MKKTILLTLTSTLLLAALAQADSWGFTLGNGAGFYYGNQPCHRPVQTCYNSSPWRSTRTVTYSQPQTVYMQPYQQMRPVYYPQTVIYRPEPIYIRESRRHCGSRW